MCTLDSPSLIRAQHDDITHTYLRGSTVHSSYIIMVHTVLVHTQMPTLRLPIKEGRGGKEAFSIHSLFSVGLAGTQMAIMWLYKKPDTTVLLVSTVVQFVWYVLYVHLLGE